MNSRYINIILLLCFCGVLFVYNRKSERTSDHMDQVEHSLAGLKKILSPTAHIWYLGLHTDTVNGRENYPLARYALAPVILEPPLDEHTIVDSILLIFRNDADHSVKFLDQGNTRIIWENRDTSYHYLLIVNNNEPH